MIVKKFITKKYVNGVENLSADLKIIVIILIEKIGREEIYILNVGKR
jgi:hypothetical protein